MSKVYDLVVIGSGPGGYVAAIKAAQEGLKTAIVEKDEIGGICLNWGCIPTKAILRSAEIYEYLKNSSSFGIYSEKISFDLPFIINRSREIAQRLSKGVSFLMKKNNIDVIGGKGKLLSPKEVEVLGEEKINLKASFILLATGAMPISLPPLPFDHKKVLSYKDALQLTEMPQSLIIIGGGAIGVEFAYFYSALGVSVTLIELLPNLLPSADREISETLEKSFTKRGIKVLTNAKVLQGEVADKDVTLFIEKEKNKEVLKADKVLVAIGVAPNTENLGLEEIGTAKNSYGFIEVNKYYQTNVPSVYAIGDCIGPPLLAHSASQEGVHSINSIKGKPLPPIDPLKVPICVYSQPQVAYVGYTEEKLKEEKIPYKIGKFPYRPNGKALCLGETDGFVKVLIGKEYGELLGCHIIGAEATEMIMEYTLGMETEITYKEILSTVHPHPTLHEITLEAVESAVGKAIHL